MDTHSKTHVADRDHDGNRGGSAPAPGTQDAQAPTATGLVTILIAEDSLTQALALRYLLERHHFEVIAASNGREAAALLRVRRPTMVITDVTMPEMDGYDLCQLIKSDDALRDLPVLLLTSLSDLKDVLKGIECGADSFVVKPYDDDVLISRIEHLLANLALRKRAGSADITEIAYDGHRCAIDTARGRSVEVLLSTFEVAVQKNRELQKAKEQLETQADELRRALAATTETFARLQVAQMQLIEAEKLQTIGQLAAGIAHEVKNPIAILELGIEWLAGSALPGDESAGLVLSDMKDAVERASLVIRDLLDFSARRTLKIGPACINALIEKTLRFVKHDLASAGVSAVKALATDLPKCQVDTNKILQVFINLFVNAVHSMPKGGTLTIKTSKTVMDADDADYQVSTSPVPRYRAGDTIVNVEIRDTGTGIPDENLKKIFDPFFTTKPAGQGTGLGLSVTMQIVDLHRGILTISNATEGGVLAAIAFTQTLPGD